jgi:hypothetical protein
MCDEPPEYIDTLAKLRAAVQIGIDELDAGLGETLDIESFLAELRTPHPSRTQGSAPPTPTRGEG